MTPDEILEHYPKVEDQKHELVITWYPGVEYPIAWDRLDTEQKILRWVCHLAEKRWMTRRTVRKFIIIACDHHGLDPFGLA